MQREVSILIIGLLLASVLLLAPIRVCGPEQRGARIDRLRFEVIKELDDRVLGMQTGEIDVQTDMRRIGDIEKLDAEGFTITSAPAFHIVYIGINIRPNRDYLWPPRARFCNPDAAYVLSDVNFRHALFHLYNQEEIVSSIYGYTGTPIQSLVPPAQGGWVNPEIPLHPYNPGNKTDTTEYDPATGEDDDACSILRYGGYVYDPGLDNWVTPYDIDDDGSAGTNHPDRPLIVTDADDVVPPIGLAGPTYEVAPWDTLHGEKFIQAANDCGLTSMYHHIIECCYMWYVEVGDFDMYMASRWLGRFPDHLEVMCHSDHDVVINPGDQNYPGCNDEDLDTAVRTIVDSLNHIEKVAAAHEAQRILYHEDYPNAAFSYLMMYSRNHFDAFAPQLRGIVNSPGYGATNLWTTLNVRWELGHERLEDGETMVVWCLGDEPPTLNPLCANSTYAWQLIDPIRDALIAVDPYTHGDVSWVAWNWTLEAPLNITVTLDSDWYLGEGVLYKSAGDTHELVNGVRVTFWLNDTVQWHCGNPYTTADAEFNWEFLRNNQIPNYASVGEHLVDAQVINPQRVTVYLDTTNQFSLYDLANTAALLPPPVWMPLDGRPLEELLAYDPSTNHTSPTGAGPRFGTADCPTQLYGTGPFIFESYDPTLMVANLHANRDYFKTCAEIEAHMVELFHKIGDVNDDGYIDLFDLSALSIAYGQRIGWPNYNPDLDLNQDLIIDTRDLARVTWYWGEQREYPEP